MWQPIPAPAGLDPTAGAANGRTSEATDDGRNGRQAGSAGRVSAAVLLVHSPQTVFIAPRTPPTHPPSRNTHTDAHTKGRVLQKCCLKWEILPHINRKKIKTISEQIFSTLKWHTSISLLARWMMDQAPSLLIHFQYVIVLHNQLAIVSLIISLTMLSLASSVLTRKRK